MLLQLRCCWKIPPVQLKTLSKTRTNFAKLSQGCLYSTSIKRRSTYIGNYWESVLPPCSYSSYRKSSINDVSILSLLRPLFTPRGMCHLSKHEKKGGALIEISSGTTPIIVLINVHHDPWNWEIWIPRVRGIQKSPNLTKIEQKLSKLQDNCETTQRGSFKRNRVRVPNG